MSKWGEKSQIALTKIYLIVQVLLVVACAAISAFLITQLYAEPPTEMEESGRQKPCQRFPQPCLEGESSEPPVVESSIPGH